MLDWRVKYLPAVTLACMTVDGPFECSEPASWERMFEWLQRRGHHQVPGRGYGMAYGVPVASVEPASFRAGVKIPKSWKAVDSAFVEKFSLPAGPYSICRHRGPYAHVPDLLEELREKWSPKGDFSLDLARPHLLIYHDDPRVISPDEQQVDVCVPVILDPVEAQNG